MLMICIDVETWKKLTLHADFFAKNSHCLHFQAPRVFTKDI